VTEQIDRLLRSNRPERFLDEWRLTTAGLGSTLDRSDIAPEFDKNRFICDLVAAHRKTALYVIEIGNDGNAKRPKLTGGNDEQQLAVCPFGLEWLAAMSARVCSNHIPFIAQLEVSPSLASNSFATSVILAST
jgi:hypothetical protein